MIQKLVIEVETRVPLESYGSNHMLVYDGTKKIYFPMTREQILAPQNEKIKQMHEELVKFEKHLEEMLQSFENKIEKEVHDFEEHSHDDYANFLKTYKETNSKMIEMVKSVVVPQGV